MVKKMSELAKMAMSEREMNSFAGGETCGCACRSVSTMDNAQLTMQVVCTLMDQRQNKRFFLMR